MKVQIGKLGIGLSLAVLSLMAANASANWTPQVQSAATATPTVDAKPVNTINLGKNGTLVGQIANGQEGLSVFFVRNGQVVKQARTSSDGSFMVRGLTEGAYSFFAAGQSDFAAYGVYVTNKDDGYSPDVLEVATASPSYAGIQQLVRSNVPSQIRNLVANASINPDTHGITRVRLINGRLNGQINSLYGNHQLSSGVKVQLIQNDQAIAQVQTNAVGQFSIPDLEPGVYDFVASSENGFTATRFEAVDSSPMMQVSFRKTAAMFTACLTAPGIANTAPVKLPIEPSSLETTEIAGDSAASGGAASGSVEGGNVGNVGKFNRLGAGARGGRFYAGAGLGGGLGGGIGGLGAAAGVAGVVGGTVAIATNDSDPDPSSPVDNN